MHPLKRIIHVDDDPDDRLLLSETIPDGLELCSLASGRALLEYLNALPAEALPVMVLLDINMPEMDGWETLLRLRDREYFSSIKVIMFTTASVQSLKTEMEHFQVEVRTKPFTYSGLRAFWEEVLEYALLPVPDPSAPGQAQPSGFNGQS